MEVSILVTITKTKEKDSELIFGPAVSGTKANGEMVTMKVLVP